MSDKVETRAEKVIEHMGIVMKLQPGDVVTDVLMIARVINEKDIGTGLSSCSIASTPNTDRIIELGLMAAAQEVMDEEAFGDFDYDGKDEDDE